MRGEGDKMTKIPTGRSTNSHVALDRRMIGGRLQGMVGRVFVAIEV
jgi:hypothetical protein